MKQTIEIYSSYSTMRLTIEVPDGRLEKMTSSDVYASMSYEQTVIADKLFGVPVAKQNLVRAQRQLERAENAVAYWHNKIYELKAKLERFSFEEDSELTERQLRILCDIDIAERSLKRKLELCGKAQEAVQEAEAAYVVDIDTFKIVRQ
jgi:hypothetical protein